MSPNKREFLHELPNTEMVKSGTNMLASGSVTIRIYTCTYVSSRNIDLFVEVFGRALRFIKVLKVLNTVYV